MMNNDGTKSANETMHDEQSVGRVFLVGAGPGDPKLLTLRAVECLQSADLVLYDYLTHPDMLAHAAKSAKLVPLGHHRQGRLLTQDEVNRRMVEAAQAGQTVVRLKSGDPTIFGRHGEEVGALREANIPYETVPGVTTATAAASAADVSLTHRDSSSAVAMVTGRRRDDRNPTPLDYDALAAFPGTLVFYMGVSDAPRWTDLLIGSGRNPKSRVTIVQRCSRERQKIDQCRLDEVVDTIERLEIKPPTVFIISSPWETVD